MGVLRKPLFALVPVLLWLGLAPLFASGAAPACTKTDDNGSHTIHGTPGNDVICANGGDDVIYGEGGSDTIYGGDGDDTILGGAGDDKLRGDAGADHLLGGPGRDDLYGGTGGGSDTADYSPQSGAVTVTVGAGLGDDGLNHGAEGDTVRPDVENVNGGAGSDDITGSASANILRGGKGNDTLSGGGGADQMIGGGGADSFQGGGGRDTVSYLAASGPVTVTTGAGADDGTAGGTEGDDVRGDVEVLIGSTYGDVLTGDGGADVMYGEDGNDKLHGAGGDDKLRGGLGQDEFDGGAGIDTVTYEATLSFGVTVTIGNEVSGDGRNGGTEDDDVQSTIETVVGTKYNDKLTGGSGNERLDGLGGMDELNGGPGIDILNGGPGIDAIYSRDTSADQVNCGDDVDDFDVDVLDMPAVNCEHRMAFGVADATSTTENTAASPVNVLANDDGDGLSVTGTSNQVGTGTFSRTGGSITFTPSGYDHLPAGGSDVASIDYAESGTSGNVSGSTLSVTVNGLNDAPTVSTPSTADAYQEGALAIPIDAGTTVDDVDDGDLIERATVKITDATKQSGDALALAAPSSKIDASFSGSTLTLTPKASETPDFTDWAAALDSVSFDTSNDTPSTSRAFDFTVYDGPVADPATRSGTAHQTMTVVPTNDAPTAMSLSNDSVAENQPAGATVGTLSTTDPDNSSGFTYALVDDAGHPDNAGFAIDGATLKTSGAFDRETKGSYSIRIKSTDSSGGSYEKDFTISVTDVDEAPVFTSSATPSVPENTTDVATVDADDPENGTVTYSITGGADQGKFSINNTTGALTFLVAPDFENKQDADSDNVYAVQVTATDGTKTAQQPVAVTVTNVNEAPTGLTLDDTTVDENHPADTPVGKASASDPEGDSLTYSMAAGTGDDDNSKFQFSNAAGDDPADLATAVANLDYEHPTDKDGDGNYQVRYKVSDGTNTVEATATITVNDLNEEPTAIGLSPNGLPENSAAGYEVGTLTSTDDDVGDTHTYSLAPGGADNGSFAIDGDKLKTKAGSSFDYETKTTYTVRIRSTDAGGREFEQDRTVTVTNVIEPPTLAAIESAPLAYIENDPATAVTGALTVGDPETTGLKTATVKLTTGRQAGEDLLSFADTADIEKAAPYNAATGVLELRVVGAGKKPAATWQSALRAVKYANSSDNPSSTDRTVEFQIDNGAASDSLSNVASRTITVTPVNDAPQPQDDTFDNAKRAVGNTALVSDNQTGTAAPDPAGPQKAVTGDILANDTDPDSPSSGFTVTPQTDANSNDGGKVTIQADGDFVFVPKPGTSCTDTSDFFDYTLNDNDPKGNQTALGRILFTIADCVWYVDGSASSTGANGTSRNPFTTLAGINGAGGAGDSDTTGDKLFLYPGTYSGGLPLENTQKLYSKRHGLAVDNGDGDGDTGDLTLEAAAPAGTGSAVTGGLDLASDNNVQGINLGDASNRAALAGTTVGTATVNTLTSGAINNTAGTAVNVNGGTLNATFSTLSSSGNSGSAVKLTGLGGTFTGSSGALSTSGGPVLDVDGGDSKVTIGSSLTGTNSLAANIRNRTGNASFVDVSGAATGTGIALSGNINNHGTTFTGKVDLDATGANTALSLNGPGSFQLTDGTSTIDAASGKAVAIDGGSQLISLGSATIKSASGLAVEVKNRTTNPSTISMAGKVDGAGIAVSNNAATVSTVNLLKMSGDVDIASGSGTGLSYTGNGQLLIDNGASSITSTSGTAVDIGNGSSAGSNDVTLAAAISTDTGRLVSVQGRTGGTTSFTNNLADTATSTGIQVKNNSGGTVQFTGGSKEIDVSGTSQPAVDYTANSGGLLRFSNGGLNAHNISGPAFKANSTTGASTLEVTGGGNVLASDANGPALEVSGTSAGNMSITSSGLTFEKIDSTGGANGIKLTNTGSSGGLTVASSGTGTCTYASQAGCTGGTIQLATGTGVVLSGVRSASFNRFVVRGSGDYGINADTVSNGVVLDASVVSGNGDVASTTENGVELVNVNGVTAIQHSDLVGNRAFNTRVKNTGAGTLDFTFIDNDVTTSAVEDGLQMLVDGPVTVRANVDNNRFTDNKGDAVQASSSTNAPGGSSELTVTNNTIDALANVATSAGIVVGPDGNVKTNVSNNNIQNSIVSAITINPNPSTTAGHTFDGTVNNNTIGTSGVPGSGSRDGDGLQVKAASDGTNKISVTNNVIRNFDKKGMLLRASESNGGNTQLTATGNQISQPGAALSEAGIWLQAGSSSSDVLSMCADVGSNTFSGTISPQGYGAFTLDYRFANAKMTAPNFSGTPQTYFQNRNSGFGTWAQDGSQTIANAPGGCSLPATISSLPAAP